MKKIEAVVRVEKIDAVVDALHALNAPGMMLTRIEGHGRQKGIVEQFRGRQYRVDLLPKAKFELVVHDADVDEVRRGDHGGGEDRRGRGRQDLRLAGGERPAHPDRGERGRRGLGVDGGGATRGPAPLIRR